MLLLYAAPVEKRQIGEAEEAPGQKSRDLDSCVDFAADSLRHLKQVVDNAGLQVFHETEGLEVVSRFLLLWTT